MAIIFSSDTGLRQTSFGQVMDYFKQEYNSVKDGLVNAFTSLTSSQPPQPPKENVYVDTGFAHVAGTAFVGSTVTSVNDIQHRNITSQEPIITMFVKKRAFRALRNENDLKFMDKGELMFMRATKILFENKCQQIAAYEALTKAQSLLDEEADLDADRISAVIDYLQDASANIQSSIANAQVNALVTTGSTSNISSQLFDDQDALNAMLASLTNLRTKSSNLRHATRTTWVTDITQPDIYKVGRGTGTIELTLVSDLNTSLGLDGSSSISFTMQDPYNLTKISNDEIEVALSAAILSLSLPKNIQGQSPQDDLNIAQQLEQQLRAERKNRIANAFGLGENSGNAVLGGTDNTEIVFEVDPTSSATDRVKASIAGMATSFNQSNLMIALLQLPPEQQPTSSENNLINQIFISLERYVAGLQLQNNNYVKDQSDPDIISARRNLRVHYLGKSIVQPMDSVNVYIRSNTFKQDELLGPLSSLLNDSPFIRSFSTKNNNVSDMILEEEMKVLGLDIPVDIYRQLRTDSLMRNAGMHVFGGLIQTVSENYSADSGIYTTQVSGTSNMQWLDQSRVNRIPSLDQTQGMLEDPLTPFDIKTAPGTGLITSTPQLNKYNQLRKAAGLINFNNGPYIGQKFDEANNYAQDYLGNGDGTAITQYKHAPGIVYKWKQGIIAVTRNVNLKTSLGDQENQTQKLRREMGLTVTTDAFSGQDAADIISLLVTGYPHNYESFYQNAQSLGNFNNVAQSNSPETYFHSFFDIHRSQNRAQGNFQPFKAIHVDPKTFHQRLQYQQYLQKTSAQLSQLRSTLAQLQDQQNTLSNQKLFTGGAQNTTQVLLTNQINDLKEQISTLSSRFKATSSDAQKKGFRLYGTDFAFDFAKGSAESEIENNKEQYNRMKFRNMLLQNRMQYDCKMNVDTNLFIVGEEYDKDLDIQAFVRNLSPDVSLWDSQFQSPKDICSRVAKILDFEFFCDSNGHIQFRPPRYNKVPLSLLLKMFLLEQEQGVTLYPPFLISLFNSRKQTVDSDITNLVTQINIEVALLSAKEPDSKLFSSVQNIGSIIDSVITAPSSFNGAGIDDVVSFILSEKSQLRSNIGGQAVNPDSTDDVSAVQQEIRSLNDPSSPDMFSNRLNHANMLAQLISRYQRLIDTKQKLDQQAGKFKDGPANVGKNPTQDLLNQFADLIEDDYNDVLGPGSASRFVIYDDQLMQSTFTESCENVLCRVDVNGQIDFIGEQPGFLGEVPMIWAGATDFDLWRQYGYKSDSAVSKPFLKDGATQCAPYAVMLLNQNRRKAVRGSITVVGNEYYQLGDVVYINSRDTLFYVTSISHNISYAGTFTTNLTLEYGRTLGDYIPTPLDVIGKGLISSQTTFNKVMSSRKTAGVSLGRHLASIVFSNSQPTADNKITMLSGDWAEFNLNAIESALSVANIYLGNNTKTSYPKIEIRGFIMSEGSRAKVESRIDAVKNVLNIPSGKYSNGDFEKVEKRYRDMAVQPEQFSDFSSAILVTGDMTQSIYRNRVPKEETFALIGEQTDNKIEDVIEIVLIFGDPGEM